MQDLADEVSNAKLFTDATSKNAIAKLIAGLTKAGAKKPASSRGPEGAQDAEPEAEAGTDEIDQSPEPKEADALEDSEVEEADGMVSIIDEMDEREDETDIL